MTRVALYARYSSDNQSVSSIEDQFRICRDQAAREKFKVVGAYKDAAISGASVTLRPGIQALLQDAQAGKFDIVLAEALDRISRDQADVAILYKHFKFAGVTLVTLAEGEISELHVGLKGTMNALFLKDLAAKTHRGLRGRVEKGKAGGGLCYGYDVVKRLNGDGEQVRGERKINEAEAEIVRRIFREFAAGKSPKAIAADLNRDGIPGPNGKAWGDTTIRGHVCRGTGIVNNELYAGVLVWNRLRYIKNPATGKRVSRVNPESEWIRTEVPDLRIVDEDLWQAARRRQEEISKQFENVTKGVRAYRAKHVNELRRPAFLFSGLLKCGCCGGNYGIITRDRYGCLNRYRRGTCDNGHTIRRDDIEQRILSGLTERLVSADRVAKAVRAYAEALNSQNRERRAQVELDRKALDKIERGIAGIMAAIEDGMYQPAMKDRMEELERQKVEILARMEQAPEDVPDIHPNIAEIYKAKVTQLSEALADPELHDQAAEAFRALVDEVVLEPGDTRGEVNATLRGEVMNILDIVSGRKTRNRRQVITKDVAGPRNQTENRPPNRGPFLLGREMLSKKCPHPPGTGTGPMTMPILARHGLTLSLFVLLLLAAVPAKALDCWVPTVDYTQAAHAQLPLAGMRAAVMTAEQVVRDNPHFKAMPRPIRIRSQIAVGPGFGQLNVKAYRPEVWQGTCGLVDGADRCCSDGGINMMFNTALPFLRPYAKDEVLEIFYEPRRSGTVAGFPEFDDMKVLLSAGGRLPWVPVTVAEFIDFFERQERAHMAEIERNRSAAPGIDMAQIERAYEGMKKVDPKAAEAFRAQMLRDMGPLTEAARQRDAKATALQAARLAEIAQLRASLTPAQLAAQAYHGKGPLNLGRPDDPLSQPLAKLDPAFPDTGDPNRVQMISVFVSVVDNDTVPERVEAMRRTKATLDYARLARLLR